MHILNVMRNGKEKINMFKHLYDEVVDREYMAVRLNHRNCIDCIRRRLEFNLFE